MTPFRPMRDLPADPNFNSKDTLAIFGELFSRGYANGLVEAAEDKGMNIIYSTVGRRDENQKLRKLSDEELAQMSGNTINIPLEAGFDLTPSSDGTTPCDQLKGLKLKDWQTAKIDWEKVNQSKEVAQVDFRKRVQQWAKELAERTKETKNLVIAHTMAGGVPRAKIIMPAMNRVFKGYGERYASSKEFWDSDLGRFCDSNFMEVTANTLKVLIEETADLRNDIESGGGQVSYTAYGYHGTEILIDGKYQWQSYSPYLQGFAKMELENIASAQWSKGIKVTVFNAPEILTNSSSIFLGIEVPLYPLLLALKQEGQSSHKTTKLFNDLKTYFIDSFEWKDLESFTSNYYNSDIIKKWSNFEEWPQHNGPEQMEAIKKASTHLLELQKDQKNPVTGPLSEIVFEACGGIMLGEASSPRNSVWWIGHDAVSKYTLR